MNYSNSKNKEKRKKYIYNTASEIFYHVGYQKASIRDISEATGLTNAGLYYYFKNKEDLLYQILNSFMDDLISEISNYDINNMSAFDFLYHCIRCHIDCYCNDIYRSKLIISEENSLSGEMYKIIKDKERTYLSYWKNAIYNICIEKDLDTENLSLYVQILVGICNWIYKWYNPYGSVEPKELTSIIYCLFLDGFLNCSDQR